MTLAEIEIESEFNIVLRGFSLERTDAPKPFPASGEGGIVLVYFQGFFALCPSEALHKLTPAIGNLGSPLQRLPLFSYLLLDSRYSPFVAIGSSSVPPVKLLVVTPRSYYLSTNARATQPGLMKDYSAVLQHVRSTHPLAKVVVYGHSLGGTGALCTFASESEPPPDALIVENAFPSIPLMLTESLYPSRFLPYHHLTPFVLDKWDALGAIESGALGRTPILFISSEEDSIVWPRLLRRMYEASLGAGGGGIPREWASIPGKGHDDAWMERSTWGKAVGVFLRRAGVLPEVDAVRKKKNIDG